MNELKEYKSAIEEWGSVAREFLNSSIRDSKVARMKILKQIADMEHNHDCKKSPDSGCPCDELLEIKSKIDFREACPKCGEEVPFTKLMRNGECLRCYNETRK